MVFIYAVNAVLFARQWYGCVVRLYLSVQKIPEKTVAAAARGINCAQILHKKNGDRLNGVPSKYLALSICFRIQQ